MVNDYKFWEDYLSKIKEKIKDLCNEKDELKIDLHIHSNFSADGEQNVREIIDSTRECGFDVIAITDHDTVEAFSELFNIVKEGITNPIVIPGVEFTMDNVLYGSQCHILQLFINPKDDVIMKNIVKNYKALFKRSKIQFKRLKENLAIREIVKKYKLKISYLEYLKYLEDNNLICEYSTLCEYLMNKFRSVGITTFEVLRLLEKYNREDCYKDRLEYKKKRFKVLREKYIESEENNFNERFLLSMLAVREVDDDWWEKPSSGSLSVNSYGQLKISEINTKYPTYFAHPTGSKFSVVEEILDSKKSIIGMEYNRRNNDLNKEEFDRIIKNRNLIKIIGSDSHDKKLTYYDDMSFYKISGEDLERIL